MAASGRLSRLRTQLDDREFFMTESQTAQTPQIPQTPSAQTDQTDQPNPTHPTNTPSPLPLPPPLPSSALPASFPNLSALVTTGFLSAAAAFSSTLLYFHYFPQVVERELPAPIAVVDVVKLAASITKASQMSQINETTAHSSYANAEGSSNSDNDNDSDGNKSALHAAQAAGAAIAKLRQAGYIVLDARYVISVPEEYVMEPSDLLPGIPGISDTPILGWGSGRSTSAGTNTTTSTTTSTATHSAWFGNGYVNGGAQWR